MKILIVNKFYYNRGGDCTCTINLEHMLHANGYETAVYAMDYPENIQTPFSKYFAKEVSFSGGIKNKLAAAARIFGGAGVKASFAKILNEFKPDIVHFNNIHSYLSPVIVKMAKDFGAKTIWTMHDYKLVCPSYSCLLNGKSCELCIGGDKKNVLKTRCMKNSLSASLLAYLEAMKWSTDKLEKYTDVYVCPSKFMADKMAQGGFDKNKIKVVCNFIPDTMINNITVKTERKSYYAYVGRLSQEKGVATLIKVASQLPHTIKIAGDGPLAAELKDRYKDCKNIEFLGRLNSSQVAELLSNAKFSVMPSECYENNPMGVIESLCFGTPVIGAKIGGIPELLEPSNGMLFRSGDEKSLNKTIDTMWSLEYDYQQISKDSIERFNSRVYLNKVLDTYK